MAKEITGYFRTVPGGAAISGVSVSLLHEDTGSAVPTTAGAGNGPMWKLATNPVTTDSNGKFTFSMELSPGPVRVEGTTGGEKKVRSGFELMQAGSEFISDIPLYGRLVSNGVLSGFLNQLNATASGTRVVTIDTGYHVVDGHIWGIDTTRAFTHDAEATFTERWDLIVIQQHIGGTHKGRQLLAVVKGTANQTDPAINLDANIKEVAIWRGKIANGSSTVVLVDLRAFAGPTAISDGLIVNADVNASAAIAQSKLALTGVLSAIAGTGLAFISDYLAVAMDAPQPNADTATNSTSTYATAMDTTFTLPTGTWTLYAVGGVGLRNATPGDAGMRIMIDGTGGTEFSASIASAAEDRQFMTNVSSKASVASGSRTVKVEYRSNNGGVVSANYVWLIVFGIRTA